MVSIWTAFFFKVGLVLVSSLFLLLCQSWNRLWSSYDCLGSLALACIPFFRAGVTSNMYNIVHLFVTSISIWIIASPVYLILTFTSVFNTYLVTYLILISNTCGAHTLKRAFCSPCSSLEGCSYLLMRFLTWIAQLLESGPFKPNCLSRKWYSSDPSCASQQVHYR